MDTLASPSRRPHSHSAPAQRPDLIFVQWLNPEILAYYDVRRRMAPRQFQRVARLLGRWGVLVANRGIVLPYTYLLEVADIDGFLTDLRQAQVAGLVHVTSATPVAGDILAKKRHEYRAELELFPGYGGEARSLDLADLNWLPRAGASAFTDISSLWTAGLDDEGFWWEILGRGARRGLWRHFGRLEERIASVPERLDGQAFIARYAVPLVRLGLEAGDRSRIASMVSQGYLRSYLREPPAALFTDTPLGPLDCGLADDPSAPVVSLAALRELASYIGIATAVDGRIPLGRLLLLRADPVWTWFVEAALEDQRGPDRPLRDAMLVAQTGSREPAVDLPGVRDRLWSFEERVRPTFIEIMRDREERSEDTPRPSGGIVIHGNVTGQNVAVGGDATQIASRGSVTVEQVWPGLSDELRNAGVPEDELDELRTALNQDLPVATSDHAPGKATRGWFVRIARGAGRGAYSVGLEVVAAIIKAHTGLDLSN